MKKEKNIIKIFSRAILWVPVFLCFFISNFTQAQNVAIIDFKKSDRYVDVVKKTWIYEDVSLSLSFEDVLGNDKIEFEKITEDAPSLGFTNSRYWLKLPLRFIQKDEVFIEIARPITNVVELYYPDHNGEYQKMQTGDGMPFYDRNFKHRKSIFHLKNMPVNKDLVLYFKLESDGEVIDLPIKIWKVEPLIATDNMEQIVNGFYYGVIVFVFIIYFFFFLALKERSFIYYVIYVLNVGLLQFSLDGLTFQYFLPDFPIIANKVLLLSACMSITFVSLYARVFLKINERVPWIDKVFKFFIGVGILCMLATLAGGVFYELTFPIINGMSLVTILFILFTIFFLKSKKHQVDIFFVLAFTLLVIGVSVFILNNLSVIPNSFFTQYAMKFGTGMEVIFLSLSMANKFRELQQEKEKAQKLAFDNLQEINKMTEEANIKLEQQVEERTKEIKHQSLLIEEKNKDITDSIRYSKRIQQAVMFDPQNFNEIVRDGFIYFNPKDIVSGDFYWFNSVTSKFKDPETNEEVDKNFVVFASVDCTGHGVPGAFMSIIGHNILQLTTHEESVNTPAQALDYLNDKVTETLTHYNPDSIRKKIEVKDGMDIAMVSLNLDENILQYAGANNPLWYISDNDEGERELFEIKADKQPIGSAGVIDHKPFTNHVLKMKKNDCIYIFTDGFPDQFGGDNGKKYKYGKFKKFLMSIHHLPMPEQRKLIKQEFISWLGDLEQIDDVCIIGVRL